ncbi:similar to Saccharomyces cerevisiae YMR280C CAT8 Zinc cluster transcriptional activator necessary for derepression of a variety of genes under non- fermentative growth conditions [Maudiozyma barnettii]|uniref:Similar to Saccharomyces cerevisiae YMR280C CAT8 Zinc cluster transcriptional activator necessary for derepression of a variety of genes under non- fermentative growth conditions n=1 Tax=Maudiozyma barnettii TaxID=61262 RepID=A0A8H2ZI02_9SACH|nr:DNA-binding transcription factor CAT8 [Kazachstania barnettii]CAB4252624.1 similar to Saccharomyces cerevisiae YMR280C CAT8 Zinc cluster transcriptional activator necessary for derepression of a variety of genes under non- fermentative growth conditions [Kazachstania barnettii]CAD1780087.1 similar to Saccharomyces cerevisiae YMR280C CAT8 Zinc cluster transcriptional activator necessary for derepression of a variety of genes under non- fermentative growth conditions [Kazachstania barnettii]
MSNKTNMTSDRENSTSVPLVKDTGTNNNNNNNNNGGSGFRVAQACDRCRSKKTRCDGKRPQCSQCAAVGFECKVSDKLIRKSFPRGYTESLEERVRELEAENRRLLAICDLKEQQINIVTNYSTTATTNNNTTSSIGGNTNNILEKDSNHTNNIKNGHISTENDKKSSERNVSSNNNNKAVLNVSQTNLVLLSQQTNDNLKHDNQTIPTLSPQQDIRHGIELSPYSNKSIPETDQTSTNISPINPLDAVDIKFHISSTQSNNHICNSGCCNNHSLITTVENEGDPNDYLNNKNASTNGKRESMESKMHAKPVATTNLNDPTTISFEQDEAPGLTAAKALKKIKNHENSTQLATLVALSIPRSTEEILFIPQLMAKIKQTFGFTSKQSLYTVTLLSSLKSDLPKPNYVKSKNNDSDNLAAESMNFSFIKHTNLWDIDDLHHFLKEVMRLDILDADTVIQDHTMHTSLNFYLRFHDIDELIELYFKHWSNLIPVLNRDEFFLHYSDFKRGIFEMNNDKNKIFNQDKIGTFNYKFFTTILVIVCHMGLLIKIKNNNNKGDNIHNLSAYYHKLIYNIPRNPYFVFSTTSVKTLQLLSLILYYHLNTGDILEIYSLRGKIISMSQQLRLHRCPSAVLVGSGSTMNKFEQSNRRILFWTIYYLDVFSSLQLGVPRLIKDHEIECALPIGAASDDPAMSSEQDEDEDLLNIGQGMSPTTVKLEGTVSQFSLAIIRFAKVMGNILDIIFKRNMSESITKQIALIHENALDNWRFRLPPKYQFKLDVTGTIDLEQLKQGNENTLLIILYFLAKSIIHLPVLASKPIVIDTSKDPKSDKLDRSSSAFVSLQQAINTMLSAFNSISSTYFALPMDSSRTLARFSVMSAQGSLDYIKGGSLYIDNKKLLLNIIQSIENDRKLGLPGVISFHSLKLLDLTINLYLQGTNVKPEKVEKFLQRKINYYNKLMGKPTIKNIESQKRSSKKTEKDQIESDENTVPNNKEQLRNSIKLEANDISVNGPEIKHEETTDLSKSLKGNNLDPQYTQTAFAEALQLDPVLNSNRSQVSNFDLGSLFANNNSGKKNIQASHLENNINNGTSNTKDITNSLNNSFSAIDKFFRIPSNGDFITSLQQLSEAGNENNNNSGGTQFINPTSNNHNQNINNNNGSRPSKMSNNNLSTMMMFLNNDFSLSSGDVNNFFNNNLQQNNTNAHDYNENNYVPDSSKQQGDYPSYNGQQTNNYNSNYDFIVDGSLGLAPLLVDESTVTPKSIDGMPHRSQQSNNAQRRNTTNNINNETVGRIENPLSANNEMVLDIPRRYTYNGTDMMTGDNSHRPTKRRKRNNDAANDLYQWQNSK